MESATTDVIVAGAGAAGLTAAVVAAARGLRVTLLEKTAYVGGTSAWSGGVAWVPANHLMEAAGKRDSIDAARRYIEAVMGEHINGPMVEAFLSNCSDAFEFLDKHTSAVRLMSYPGIDYYLDLPGATSHRGMMVKPYDARELGDHLESLQYPLRALVIFRSMQADVTDVYHLQRMLRSWKSFAHSTKLVARYARDRLHGRRGTRTLRGNALIARLYRSALDLGVQVIREAPVLELTRAGDRISGVVYERSGKRVALAATRGVILATGGVSGNEQFRSMLVPFAKEHVSMLPEGNVGDGVAMGIAQGASLGESKRANVCLTPVSWLQRKDGTVVKYPHLAFDRCKPGSIIVDARGRRFTNEAGTYHDVGKAMQDAGAVPAFLVADSRFQRWYGMGMARPRPYPVAPLLDCGYLVKGATLTDLARRLGIDAAGLAETVERMNEAARSGVDQDFGRGANAYNRELGDPEHSPNPCLGEIRHAPFYAVKLYPGDIGTLTGLKVNTHAQVLGESGQPIAGLYACGLDIDNVFCGFYPGAGSTHGPNITFAYVAASHLAAGAEIQGTGAVADPWHSHSAAPVHGHAR